MSLVSFRCDKKWQENRNSTRTPGIGQILGYRGPGKIFFSSNSIGNRLPARKNPLYKVKRRIRTHLGEIERFFLGGPLPNPKNSHYHRGEFQGSKSKNSYRFPFRSSSPCRKTPEYKKSDDLEHFLDIRKKSIFPSFIQFLPPREKKLNKNCQDSIFTLWKYAQSILRIKLPICIRNWSVSSHFWRNFWVWIKKDAFSLCSYGHFIHYS